MEEIIVEEQVEKRILVTEKVKKYKTRDGQIFDNSIAAAIHEFGQITTKEFEVKFKLKEIQLSDIGDIKAIYIKTLDEESLIHINNYFGSQFKSKALTTGINLITIDNSGDYPWMEHLDINHIEKEVIKDLATIKELKEYYAKEQSI